MDPQIFKIVKKSWKRLVDLDLDPNMKPEIEIAYICGLLESAIEASTDPETGEAAQPIDEQGQPTTFLQRIKEDFRGESSQRR